MVNELLAKTNCQIIIAARSESSLHRGIPFVDRGLFTSGRLACRQFDFESIDNQINYFEYFEKPDICIHLAWQGLPNYKESFHIDKNLPQQYTFIKNLVTNGLQRLTVTGTCFEYGMQQGCLGENMEAKPDNAYAWAKYKLYLLLVKLQQEIPFQLNWLRLFYMYGKGQNPKALFSQLEAALQRGDEVFNMSGGEQERDFLPIEKVTENIVTIAIMEQEAGLVNCCSGKPVKVKDWVNDYLAQQNARIKLNLGYYPYADYEPMAFWGNAEKLQTILNKLHQK